MRNSGTQIANKTQLKLEPVEIGGINYTPEIDAGNLTVALNANELTRTTRVSRFRVERRADRSFVWTFTEAPPIFLR